jgi:hypothetical protein
MERALAVFLAAHLTGCSFIGVHSVPPVENCTEGSALPIFDTVGAVVIGGFGLVGSIANDIKPPGERFEPATIGGAVLLAIGITLAISAWWGFRNDRRCREARGGPVFGTP